MVHSTPHTKASHALSVISFNIFLAQTFVLDLFNIVLRVSVSIEYTFCCDTF